MVAKLLARKQGLLEGLEAILGRTSGSWTSGIVSVLSKVAAAANEAA